MVKAVIFLPEVDRRGSSRYVSKFEEYLKTEQGGQSEKQFQKLLGEEVQMQFKGISSYRDLDTK